MIVHFYTSFPSRDPATQQRNAVAAKSWARQPWKERPIERKDLARVFQDGDAELYYIKDMFDLVCSETEPNDILVYTNADIMVRGDCSARIADHLQRADACWASRRDFHHDFDEPIPDADFVKGIPYCGKDLFAFRNFWWAANREYFPDMLVAREAWDAILFTLIEMTNTPGPNELYNMLAHKKHNSVWEQHQNRYRLKSQRHNIALALGWCGKFGVDPGPFGLRAA